KGPYGEHNRAGDIALIAGHRPVAEVLTGSGIARNENVDPDRLVVGGGQVEGHRLQTRAGDRAAGGRIIERNQSVGIPARPHRTVRAFPVRARLVDVYILLAEERKAGLRDDCAAGTGKRGNREVDVGESARGRLDGNLE